MSIEKDVDVKCVLMAQAPVVSVVGEMRWMDVWGAALRQDEYDGDGDVDGGACEGRDASSSSLTKERRKKWVVVTAGSDGYVRVWRYVEEEGDSFDEVTRRRFELTESLDFHLGRCVLKVVGAGAYDHLMSPRSSKGHRRRRESKFFATAGTDGKVSLWGVDGVTGELLAANGQVGDCVEEGKGKPQPLWWFQSHQSGVNALDLWIDASNEDVCTITIASGGEDNGLTVVRLCVQIDFSSQPDLRHQGNVLKFEVIQQRVCRIPSFHASIVTGVKVVDDGRKLLSVGVDQKLQMWEIHEVDDAEGEEGNEGGLTLIQFGESKNAKGGLSFTGGVSVDVSDVSDMDVLVVDRSGSLYPKLRFDDIGTNEGTDSSASVDCANEQSRVEVANGKRYDSISMELEVVVCGGGGVQCLTMAM
jgi:WD40 repeat protein